MNNFQRIRKPGRSLLVAAGVLSLIGVPFIVNAQKGRPVPGRIQTLTPYFLLKGQVAAVDGNQVIIKTADYGPGLSNAAGVHSHAIVSGKSYLVDLSKALFQATDGTSVARQPLVVGDKVVMLVNSTPGPQQQVGNTTMFRFTVNEVIRNDQTPTE